MANVSVFSTEYNEHLGWEHTGATDHNQTREISVCTHKQQLHDKTSINTCYATITSQVLWNVSVRRS